MSSDDGIAGGPWAGLIPQTQLDNYQIILNTQEIDLRPDRTNCTTRDHSEEDRKYGDMVWERNGAQGLQKVGSAGQGER